MLTLKDLKPGTNAKVLRIHGNGALKRRIMDMGMIRNTEFSVRKAAPLGDPVEIHVRGYELTIRKTKVSLLKLKQSMPEKG